MRVTNDIPLGCPLLLPVVTVNSAETLKGNVTKASMEKLFDVLRSKFEFGESARFIDLGHGMGRPSIHAAALHPHIAGAFGMEFNPQLYKQSMLALQECALTLDCFLEQPRVFFMDSNIKVRSCFWVLTDGLCLMMLLNPTPATGLNVRVCAIQPPTSAHESTNKSHQNSFKTHAL
jgi:hypothetical protein